MSRIGGTRPAPNRVAKFHTPEIVVGPGSFPEAGAAASGLGVRRPLVVSDHGLEHTPWYARLLDDLGSQGLVTASYLDVSPNPRAGEVSNGFAAYRAHGADGIIALGGDR